MKKERKHSQCMLSWQPNYLLKLPARMAKIEKIQLAKIRRKIEKNQFNTTPFDGGHVGKIPAKILLGAGHFGTQFSRQKGQTA